MERIAKVVHAICTPSVNADRSPASGRRFHRYRRLAAASLATLGLVSPLAASPALAELQIHANEGLLTVGFWNWTPYYLARDVRETTSSGFNPSPFWTSMWPYQQTGVSFSSHTSGSPELVFNIEIQDDGVATGSPPVFTLDFSETTSWDIKAVADLLLHQAKSGAVSWAKKQVKNQVSGDPAKDAAKEAATATAAEFGMEEIKIAVKVFKEIGKIFNALNPERKIKLKIYTPSKPSESDFSDVCLNRSDDNATQRVVGPPGVELDWSTADQFYVVTAGSVTGGQSDDDEPPKSAANKAQPGMIDMAVTPLCDFVCGAFNGIASDLIQYSQDDCVNAQSDDNAKSQFEGAQKLLECLQNPNLPNYNSPLEGSVRPQAYLVPPRGDLDTYDPDRSCDVQSETDYYDLFFDGISNPPPPYTVDDFALCGQCVTDYPYTTFTEAEGSWSQSCDLITFDGESPPELCANCADAESPVRDHFSCASCPSNQYGNADGQLFCE